MNFAVEGLTFGLALFFLVICLVAAIQTLSGGRHSSGVHFVPSLLAIAGVLLTQSHLALGAVIVILDIGSLFAVLARRQPRS